MSERMTPERLAEIREMLPVCELPLGVESPRGCFPVEDAAGDLLAEVDRLAAELREAHDCGQDGVCATPPGCCAHWEERSRELVAERDEARLALSALWEAVREVLDEPHAYIGGRERAALTAALSPCADSGASRK